MKRLTKVSILAVGVVIGFSSLSACGQSATNTAPTSEASKSATSAPIPSEDGASIIKSLRLTQRGIIPNSVVIMLPASWEPTITPGASKSWIVNTTSDNDSVGVSRLSGDTTIVDEKVLSQTASTLVSVSKQSFTPITKVLSPQLGYIQSPTDSGVVESWLVSKPGAGTYLFILGAKPQSAGKPSSASASPTTQIGSGSASDQTQAVIRNWLRT